MKDSLDRIELRSESIQEILTDLPNWMIRWGSMVFLILIIVIITISWNIKYPDVINAKATITTLIPPEKEISKITAKFDTILVGDGDYVRKGTILAILENTANFEDVFRLKSILKGIDIKRHSLFSLSELPIMYLGEIENDFYSFQENYSEYKHYISLKPYSNENTANRKLLVELNSRVENLRFQKEINYKEIILEEKKMKRQRTLYKKGVISLQDVENIQLNFLKAKRSYQNLTILISNTKEEITRLNKEFNSSYINHTIKEEYLYEKLVQSHIKLLNSITRWEQLYIFKSRINGMVSFHKYWSKNQTVKIGEPVFSILPEKKSSYIAKLSAPSTNSGKIKIGQKVYVAINNYPEAEYGFLTGEVSNISSFENEDGFYLVDVSLPSRLITNLNKKIKFKYEMSGEGAIITQDLRFLERVFYEFRSLLNTEK